MMKPEKAGSGRSPVAYARKDFFSTHSSRADQFTESVIREMTRLSLQYNAINLLRVSPIFLVRLNSKPLHARSA
jgi:hypothetical protein